MSTIRIRKYVSAPVPCHCCTKQDEIVVRQGLAYTPSEMAQLQARGMPVNCENVQSMFYDGSQNPSWHIESYKQRNVDVADLWEEHEIIVEKAKSAASKS